MYLPITILFNESHQTFQSNEIENKLNKNFNLGCGLPHVQCTYKPNPPTGHQQNKTHAELYITSYNANSKHFKF